MKWANGKWIRFSYINHLGYKCGHYAFIQSTEEFKDVADRYRIKFENLLNFEINGMKCSPHDVKGWF
jgi:hypothetical protein